MKKLAALLKKLAALLKKLVALLKTLRGLLLVTRAGVQIGWGAFLKARGMVTNQDALPESAAGWVARSETR